MNQIYQKSGKKDDSRQMYKLKPTTLLLNIDGQHQLLQSNIYFVVIEQVHIDFNSIKHF